MKEETDGEKLNNRLQAGIRQQGGDYDGSINS